MKMIKNLIIIAVILVWRLKPKWRAWRILQDWNGHEMSDQEVVDYCLEKLEGKTNRRRSLACFVINFPNGRGSFGKIPALS